ncbi:hypothetical protein SAMN05428941_2489 [Streptomyces sp. 2114.2]|nr:hypothetical protein SAMN05428941_2489 [Streptomyces sp. 2114.2]
MRSGKGDRVASVAADSEFDPVLSGVDRKRYPILGHLDPYGDTVLNRLQVESLVEEISEVRTNQEIISSEFADKLVALCRECLLRPHRFLWFVGE